MRTISRTAYLRLIQGLTGHTGIQAEQVTHIECRPRGYTITACVLDENDTPNGDLLVRQVSITNEVQR